MHVFWEGLLTNLPASLVSAGAVALASALIRARSRRRRRAADDTGE
ncbi:hypothetical protein [Streptomyces sp. NPDC002889]